MIDGTPHLVACGHFKTKPKQPLALRYVDIEQQFTQLIEMYESIHRIVRENFVSRIPDTNQKVFGAWASVDRALITQGYEVNSRVNPLSLKKRITGKGKAEKEDVAAAVRKLLRLPEDYKFSSSDASDACALVLYDMLEEGNIQ